MRRWIRAIRKSINCGVENIFMNISLIGMFLIGLSLYVKSELLFIVALLFLITGGVNTLNNSYCGNLYFIYKMV